MGGLAALFALVTIGVAGWRGLRSLVALGLSLVLAIRVLIPLLLAGWNPLVLAIVLGSGHDGLVRADPGSQPDDRLRRSPGRWPAWRSPACSRPS